MAGRCKVSNLPGRLGPPEMGGLRPKPKTPSWENRDRFWKHRCFWMGELRATIATYSHQYFMIYKDIILYIYTYVTIYNDIRKKLAERNGNIDNMKRMSRTRKEWGGVWFGTGSKTSKTWELVLDTCCLSCDALSWDLQSIHWWHLEGWSSWLKGLICRKREHCATFDV